MRSLVIAGVLSLATIPALADAPAKPAKPTPAPTAQPSTAAPAPTTCKNVVVGKGRDRKVVCEITGPVVPVSAPKPNVVIVPRDGKAVTGRPKSEDRLKGLGPHTK